MTTQQLRVLPDELAAKLPLETTLCPVCYNDGAYNVSTCVQCQAKACRKCLQTYILSRKEEPHCYQCHASFTDAFVASATSLHFQRNALRKHQQDVLWDREIALLPLTMSTVEAKVTANQVAALDHYKNFEKGFKYKISRIIDIQISARKSLLTLHQSYTKCTSDAERYLHKVQIRKLENLCHCYDNIKVDFLKAASMVQDVSDVDTAVSTTTYNKIVGEINDLRQTKDELLRTAATSTTTVLDVFKTQTNDLELKHVPYKAREAVHTLKCFNADCRGFFNKEGICGLCKSVICLRCWKDLTCCTSGHECATSDLDTKSTIVADSKQCPKCKIMIHRSEGCDHMWCVMCKTGFNWKTLKLVSNQENTNPLLAAWQRENHTANDNESFYTLNVSWGKEIAAVVTNVQQITRIFRTYVNGLRQRELDLGNVTRELRVDYLLKLIDEPTFKKLAMEQLVRIKCTLHIIQALQWFNAATKSLLEAVRGREVKVDTQKVEILAALKKLRLDFNAVIDLISVRYYFRRNAPEVDRLYLSEQFTLKNHSF